MHANLVPVLLCVGQHDCITNIVVQQQPGVSKPTPTRYLDELEKDGYLQKTGTAEPGQPIDIIGS